MVKNILLAEDDEDDSSFFVSFLKERTDLHILPVMENGEEALAFLENTTQFPDVIILDQNMPKRNGVQTLSLLKEDSRYAHIPVIIYSTYHNEVLENQCASLGALMIVPKPTSKQGYHEMIDNIFNTMLKYQQ